MGIITKLDSLMKKENITKAELSRQTGIPYTTIDGFYKKGTDNIKLSTLKRLCNYFQCSLDYLTMDEVQDGKIMLDEIFESHDFLKTR